jgi:hypothetical protein
MSKGLFPPPTTPENVKAYLSWSDWTVLGMLHEGLGGEDGERIRTRNHARKIHETSEHPDMEELEFIDRVSKSIEDDGLLFVDKAGSSWYKLDSDIRLLCNPGQDDERTTTLSDESPVVRGLKAGSQHRVYAYPENLDRAKKAIESIKKEGEK